MNLPTSAPWTTIGIGCWTSRVRPSPRFVALAGNAAGVQVKLPKLPLGMALDAVQVTSAGVAVIASGHAAETRGKASGGGPRRDKAESAPTGDMLPKKSRCRRRPHVLVRDRGHGHEYVLRQWGNDCVDIAAS
ncbi:MAG TPA: hypothetical protein VGL39_21450 [Jatrophihabitantaceae bacterium]|jgi:hypothetical protein